MLDRFKQWASDNRWLLIVACSAALVRIAYVIELSFQPGFTVPMVDERWHWEWAHEILRQSFWGEGTLFRGPLYPYFLAFLAWLTGSSIFWAKVLQVLIAFGTGAFIYRLSEHLFDRRVAVVAGFMYALYGVLVFYESMFLIPVIFLFFTVWGIYRLVRFRESPSIRTWLVTGIIFGLAAISRPNILITMPVLAIWLYFALGHLSSVVRRVLPVAALTLGVLLAVLPVTLRNYLVADQFVLISSQGGVNLYLGNNPVANGLTMLMPEVELNESVSWRQFIPATNKAAEKETGRTMTDAEISSFWSARAIDWMASNPRDFIALTFKKVVYLLSGFENSDNADIYHERHQSRLYSALVWHAGLYFPFGLLLPLFVGGVIMYRHRWRDLLPIYLFILAYIPSIVLFLVTARHRLPLVPFMIVLAAALVVGLIGNWRKMSGLRRIALIAIMLVVALVFNRTFFDTSLGSEFQRHFNDGLRSDRLEDYQGAEKAYLRAIEANPFSAVVHNNLGYAQFRLGKNQEANRNYHRSIEINPEYALPYNNLGLLMMRQERLDSAITLFHTAARLVDTAVEKPRNVAQIWLNLGEAFEQLGHIDSAAVAHMKAAEAAPLWGEAWFRGAAFFARIEQYELTDTMYVRGMRVHDLSAADFFNWGLSLVERRQFSQGVNILRRGLKRDESMHQIYYVIAVSYLEGGMPLDSVMNNLDLCLHYEPTYEPAKQLKNYLLQNPPVRQTEPHPAPGEGLDTP
jgi:tetratricopeptide (TPR) repeat protein